jgi:hypothetical protein
MLTSLQLRTGWIIPLPTPPDGWTSKRSAETPLDDAGDEMLSNYTSAQSKLLHKRIEDSLSGWAPSQMSVPPGVDWSDPASGFIGTGQGWKYQRDASECQGQYVRLSSFPGPLDII